MKKIKCSYPDKIIGVSISIVAYRYVIQTIVKHILLRNARVLLAIIKVETMMEITIEFYIWKQVIHLWGKKSTWFSMIVSTHFIFIKLESLCHNHLLWFVFFKILNLFNPTLLSQLILPPITKNWKNEFQQNCCKIKEK